MMKLFFFFFFPALVRANCPGSLGPGQHLRTIDVGGVERKFYVYVPTVRSDPALSES
jgi:hypothetical protein